MGRRFQAIRCSASYVRERPSGGRELWITDDISTAQVSGDVVAWSEKPEGKIAQTDAAVSVPGHRVRAIVGIKSCARTMLHGDTVQGVAGDGAGNDSQ